MYFCIRSDKTIQNLLNLYFIQTQLKMVTKDIIRILVHSNWTLIKQDSCGKW